MSTPQLIDGKPRFFGRLPRVDEPGRHFAKLDETIPILPPDDWTETDTQHLVWDLLDQNSYGACVTCTAILALQMARTLAGLPNVKLSWGHLYGQINAGYDEGATLADAMQALLTTGVCDAQTIALDNWHPDTWPTNWRENAARHRFTEVWDCPTLPHAWTATREHWPVVFGIKVFTNFIPDADGYIPGPAGLMRGRHAMPLLGIHYRNGVRYARSQNSWGPWGLNNTGRCFLPESLLASESVADAWAGRVTVYAKRS
jgi:hypothetical protein